MMNDKEKSQMTALLATVSALMVAYERDGIIDCHHGAHVMMIIDRGAGLLGIGNATDDLLRRMIF